MRQYDGIVIDVNIAWFRLLSMRLTWAAEGTFDQCKKPHWPGNKASGVTWGKGLDVGSRTAEEVLSILRDADIKGADWFVGAAGLKGKAAQTWIRRTSLTARDLTEPEMKRLFTYCWDEQFEEVFRICNKPDVVSKYGRLDFNKVDARIVAMLVDLKYRGDYDSELRKLIQQHAVNNDFNGFRSVILQSCSGWPINRAKLRSEFLA